jgi:hypothetical protein
MQKEMKLLDSELANNQLVRVHDPSPKTDQSLFRALAMAVYYSHQYADQIKSELRLTLACNLAERKSNPYPPLNEG